MNEWSVGAQYPGKGWSQNFMSSLYLHYTCRQNVMKFGCEFHWSRWFCLVGLTDYDPKPLTSVNKVNEDVVAALNKIK